MGKEDIVTVSLKNGALKITSDISFNWSTVTKSEIEKADGRKKTEPKIWEHGSYLYVAKSKNKKVIYVGETSKSIKRRFCSDGRGSHKHKKWYSDMDTVDYVRYDESTLDIKQRKLLEQALSIVLKPLNYYKQNT